MTTKPVGHIFNLHSENDKKLSGKSEILSPVSEDLNIVETI